MSDNFTMLEKIMLYKHNFNNSEINEAFSNFKNIFEGYIKKYPNPDTLLENISIEDEIADFSVVLLNAIDLYDDLEDEIEVKTFLEIVWNNELN